MAVIKLYPEHRIRKRFGNRPLHFNDIFLSHSGGASASSLEFRQDPWPRLCDRDRMLKMSRKTPVAGHRGPTVF
jgi:hypothetical protein